MQSRTACFLKNHSLKRQNKRQIIDQIYHMLADSFCRYQPTFSYIQALGIVFPNVRKCFGYLPVFKLSCYTVFEPQKSVGGIRWRKLDGNKDGKVKGENSFLCLFLQGGNWTNSPSIIIICKTPKTIVRNTKQG